MFPLVIATLLFAAGSWAVARWASHQEARARAVDLAPSLPVQQLQQDSASVAQEMGAGSFRQLVKIRGIVGCDRPLEAELSKTPCVSYRFSVTREYEEVVLEKDADGHPVRRLQRRSEIVAQNAESTVFWIDDGTAKILVHPEGADLEHVKSHDAFQPLVAGSGIPSPGLFGLSLTVVPGGTLGYRSEEHCLPVGSEVTIVAEAGDAGGALALRKPEAGDLPFLVSTKDPQDLARGQKTLTLVLKGVSWGLAAVSVLIFLVGVIR